jgi:CRISPR-associated protein Cst1
MDEQMVMKHEDEKTIVIPNIEICYEKTGDPFVDAGGIALRYIAEKFPEKNTMQLIEWATQIYVERWESKLNAVFLNSPITQASKKAKQKIMSTLTFFIEMTTNKKNVGFCRFCGQKAHLTQAGRDKSCLVGSGAFVNFHHGHEEGLMICPSCVTKYFFLPFALIQMGNLALLHTVTNFGEEYWKKKTVVQNLDKLSRNSSDSILNSDLKKPKNAIFFLAAELINEFQNELLNENLTLYYFTNYAASVDCSVYSIPNPVFIFLSKTLKSVSTQWNQFVYSHYYFPRAKSDEVNSGQKRENQAIEDQYFNKNNSVYNALLEGKSILGMMKKYYRNQTTKNSGFDSRMAVYYAKEVLQMTNEQIAMIRKIGLKVFDLMESGDNFKKYMVKLEGTTKAHQFRSALLTIVKRNYLEGNEEPIVTLEEWVNYLFPDGSYWGEVRDLLLIFLYEKMHESNIRIDLHESEVEETTEQEENEGA